MTATTVFAAFNVLKDHVKFKVSQDSVVIDNLVFRLHYRGTFLLLLVASILVSSRQFIGEHIRCIADAGVPNNVIETFCFFTSTYTVVKHMNATAVLQGELPHPGVGPAANTDPITHHAYYQWVPFVLFFQALLFYLPHYVWRRMEGGRLKMLVSGLQMACLALNDSELKVSDNIKVPSKKDRDNRIEEIRIGFINRLHLNRPWAYGLTFCEVMNFINVIMQIYVTDSFLGGAFLGLGQSVSKPVSKDEMDPLDVVFPKKYVIQQARIFYGLSWKVQSVERAESHSRISFWRLAIPLLHCQELGQLRFQGAAAATGAGFREQTTGPLQHFAFGRRGDAEEALMIRNPKFP